mmetsp:Transcript_18197/g.25642  ORF Transcript_18197/g.25642 Transcript_18197/m.25642 type:complete len:249 (-) Transcript_18197:66-812(-)
MSPQTAASSETITTATAAKPPPASTGAAALEFEPPLACVRRILKNSLPSSTNVGKDASSAFARASGIFVIYLTACANDFARENRRQTITANDVLAAVKELDFDEFTPQLTAFLEKHRATEKSKKVAKAKAKEDAKLGGGLDDMGEHDLDDDEQHSNNDETPTRPAKKPRLEKEEGEPETPNSTKTPTSAGDEQDDEGDEENSTNNNLDDDTNKEDDEEDEDEEGGEEHSEKAQEDDKEGDDDAMADED